MLCCGRSMPVVRVITSIARLFDHFQDDGVVDHQA
jgi:hypothetical protein